ncbi:MAG: YopX family protein, partial [Bacteroidales bacterium]
VIPESIGQYVGLNDSKRTKEYPEGQPIYEGDIVHCNSQFDSGDMVVIFEEGQFRMVCLENYKDYITGMGYYAIQCFEKEVIGNIHDKEDTP